MYPLPSVIRPFSSWGGMEITSEVDVEIIAVHEFGDVPGRTQVGVVAVNPGNAVVMVGPISGGLDIQLGIHARYKAMYVRRPSPLVQLEAANPPSAGWIAHHEICKLSPCFLRLAPAWLRPITPMPGGGISKCYGYKPFPICQTGYPLAPCIINLSSGHASFKHFGSTYLSIGAGSHE